MSIVSFKKSNLSKSLNFRKFFWLSRPKAALACFFEETISGYSSSTCELGVEENLKYEKCIQIHQIIFKMYPKLLGNDMFSFANWTWKFSSLALYIFKTFFDTHCAWSSMHRIYGIWIWNEIQFPHVSFEVKTVTFAAVVKLGKPPENATFCCFLHCRGYFKPRSLDALNVSFKNVFRKEQECILNKPQNTAILNFYSEAISNRGHWSWEASRGRNYGQFNV